MNIISDFSLFVNTRFCYTSIRKTRKGGNDMKITILNGSPREGGNTEIMADAFMEEAQKNGHEVTKLNVGQMDVIGCMACESCFSDDGYCVIEDDMQDIIKVLDETDLVVLASPIYWFDITAQLKAVIDRLYARVIKGFHIRESVLLLDSMSDDVFDAAVAQYKAMTDYVHWTDRGIITISGMQTKGAMAEHEKLTEVRELAASL